MALKKRPCAYQMYISKDYCANTHADDDISEFTLCYASHPNSRLSPINFIIPEYGIQLPIRDGDLFAFQSSIVHGTGYRIPTANPAYISALTINDKLADVLIGQRRQYSIEYKENNDKCGVFHVHVYVNMGLIQVSHVVMCKPLRLV